MGTKKQMSEKATKIPQIRFDGYTDAWEQRKLGEIGKTQSGIGFPDNEQGGLEGVPFFKVSDMNNAGNEHEMKTANNYVSEEQLKRKKWKPIETVPAVMFAKVGAAIMLNRKRIVRTPFLIDNNTMAYVFDESWDTDFGKTLFETINLPRYAQVGALPSYNGSDIESIEISIPNKDEQIKIGSFFSNLDHIITLHQRECDLLAKMKKSYLQKMFPKNGEDKPEIRFAGFTDAWEQRKFKEFSKKTGKKNTKDLDFPAYSVSNKAGLISQTEQFDGSRLDDLEKTNYKFVEPNEFAYNPARVNVGSIAFNNLGMTVIVSSLYVVVKMSEDLDNEFILQFIKSPTFIKEVKRNTEGSVREYLFYENFANIKFPFTRNKEEQQKIGNFFKQLDDTIALHQRELDSLKKMKKSLLQMMFV